MLSLRKWSWGPTSTRSRTSAFARTGTRWTSISGSAGRPKAHWPTTNRSRVSRSSTAASTTRPLLIEKKIGDVSYASARVTATIAENWNLTDFPFDWHRTQVRIEDSALTALDLVFVPDKTNSRLGDEIDMAGWRASNFMSDVQGKIYRTNYGDTSLPTDAQSEYSRYVIAWNMDREGWGTAFKLLSTVILATGVAFVSFMVKPSDLDARFGMGVGALFAVAASAFIVSASVPDSASLTVADRLHMVALGGIFVTLLISALLPAPGSWRARRTGLQDRPLVRGNPAAVVLRLGRVDNLQGGALNSPGRTERHPGPPMHRFSIWHCLTRGPCRNRNRHRVPWAGKLRPDSR